MASDRATSRTMRESPGWSLSFLAPASLVLLPIFALAFTAREKNEAYEWTQHRLVGAGFVVAFATAFIFGRWRRGSWAAVAALFALIAVAMVTQHGLLGTHILFAVAGGMVGIGYWFARRDTAFPVLEAVVVGFCSMLSFWATSRLSWWQPFNLTLVAGSAKLWFVGVSALLVWLLFQMEQGEDKGGRPPVWIGRVIDVVTLGFLAALVLRTNCLLGNPAFAHHWSVFVAPAEMVREGRLLLGEVPSQYGFLSTLLLAGLPTDDRFTALFWLQSAAVWSSGAILYFTLRTWLARWWWQLGAGLVTLCAVTFICGDASTLIGPMTYPSVGAVRFIWVHVLLGFLLWQHRRRATHGNINRSRVLWGGSFIWLLGVLWSVESAVYVTAAWLPAASLLAMRPVVDDLNFIARVRALFAGIGYTLAIAGLLLVSTIVLITTYYYFGLSRMPEWRAYWEYAVAFSEGFGTLPIESEGGVWVLVLLHIALLASIVSLEIDRQRSSLSLIWSAWGALWTVSTYYVSRSHVNNITNLSPVLLLIVGLMVHVSRSDNPSRLARPWIWLTVPPFVGAMLWLVLSNPNALRRQLSGYFVEQHVSRLLPPTPPDLAEFIRQCQLLEPGPYSVLPWFSGGVVKAETAEKHVDWLPIGSMPLFDPLSSERRAYYLDAYYHRLTNGWLIAPSDRDAKDLAWFFEYIDSRYTVAVTLEYKGWQAWYYVPRPDWHPALRPR